LSYGRYTLGENDLRQVPGLQSSMQPTAASRPRQSPRGGETVRTETSFWSGRVSFASSPPQSEVTNRTKAQQPTAWARRVMSKAPRRGTPGCYGISIRNTRDSTPRAARGKCRHRWPVCHGVPPGKPCCAAAASHGFCEAVAQGIRRRLTPRPHRVIPRDRDHRERKSPGRRNSR